MRNGERIGVSKIRLAKIPSSAIASLNGWAATMSKEISRPEGVLIWTLRSSHFHELQTP